MAHPAGAIYVGVCSRDRGLAHHAQLAPIAWYGTQRHIVVFSGNRLQLSDQGKVRSKSRERLNDTGDSLSGSVENAIVALRIVEAITESPIGCGATNQADSTDLVALLVGTFCATPITL